MIKTPLSTVIGGAFWTPGCTVIGGTKLSSETVMKKLFSNGEQGFFYDPNDLTTLYQDAAGTIPVTAAGQTVGLMLDKSKGLVLGENKATVSQVIGAGIGGSAFKQSTITSTLVVGKWYVVTAKVSNFSGTGNVGFVNTGGTTAFTDVAAVNKFTSVNGVMRFIGIATGTTQATYTRSSNNADFSEISICELKGNHAYQTVSSMRPLLVAAPQRLDYDAVDDKLITNLPTQLTGCTVIRSVPNVGTQILANQTIPTPYNDNIDNCGLIVINRALTASETSQITKLFNKAAGV